jgi:hypothetical protein
MGISKWRLPASVAAIALALVLGASATPAGLTFAQATVSTAELTAEPSIAIDPASGAVYYTAPGPNVVWKSIDGGASWTPHDSPSTEGDSDLAVDANGRVYLSGLLAAGTLDSTIPVSTSLDGGITWARTRELVPGASGVECDRQWTAARGNGIVVTSANCDNGYKVWRSTDAADTFFAPVVVDADASVGGPLTFGSGGTLYTIFMTFSSGLRYAKSADNGVNWSSGQVTPNGSQFGFPVIEADAGGNLYAAWDEDPGTSLLGQSVVKFSRSTDGGASWSSPEVVSNPLATSLFPWISARTAGKVDVSFFVADTRIDPNLGLPVTKWDIEVAQSLNAAGPSPTFTRDIAVNDFHTGSVCTSGLLCLGPQNLGIGNAPTPFDRRMLDFFETAVNSSGNLLIAYAKDRPFPGTFVGDLILSWNDLKVARQSGGPTL